MRLAVSFIFLQSFDFQNAGAHKYPRSNLAPKCWSRPWPWSTVLVLFPEFPTLLFSTHRSGFKLPCVWTVCVCVHALTRLCVCVCVYMLGKGWIGEGGEPKRKIIQLLACTAYIYSFDLFLFRDKAAIIYSAGFCDMQGIVSLGINKRLT